MCGKFGGMRGAASGGEGCVCEYGCTCYIGLVDEKGTFP